MLGRLVTGFETLVRAKDLNKAYRHHSLSYMRFGQCVVHLEYVRQDQILVFIDEPFNKRALQFDTSTSSAGYSIKLLQSLLVPSIYGS